MCKQSYMFTFDKCLDIIQIYTCTIAFSRIGFWTFRFFFRLYGIVYFSVVSSIIDHSYLSSVIGHVLLLEIALHIQ